jgi:hypothetical protein
MRLSFNGDWPDDDLGNVSRMAYRLELDRKVDLTNLTISIAAIFRCNP